MKNYLCILLAICIVGCNRDAAPKGEGSYAAAELMFTEIENIPASTIPDGYTRYDFEDGSWIAMRGIDSHNSPDGGTLGVLTDTGEYAVFFTHVCGPGPTPLEGMINGALTSSDALSDLRARSKEYNR